MDNEQPPVADSTMVPIFLDEDEYVSDDPGTHELDCTCLYCIPGA